MCKGTCSKENPKTGTCDDKIPECYTVQITEPEPCDVYCMNCGELKEECKCK